ncbi:MAG: hypothetical protein K2N12_01865 [Helicobacter sp.]|nr:hypothetical protein [Helicobacter sp.]
MVSTTSIKSNTGNANGSIARQPKGKDASLLLPPQTETTNAKVESARAIAPIDEQFADETSTASRRQTYGLKILELMDDYEYSVFERVTDGMRDSERMLSAQALYSISDLAGEGNYAKGIKNGYGNTFKFAELFSKAYMWGDVNVDERI